MCAKATAAASGFSISGLLDASSKTRERFPVSELDITAVSDHPANAAYSMDAADVAALADSIARDGLTDIPLVRKLADGSWQMLSGHRRKAAFTLLAEKDPSFSKMPCCVVSGITDDQALVLLHTANYFVRELNVMERAAATRALGIEVERMRVADPSLKGRSTADIKADIISANTGMPTSASTIKRQEATARKIEDKLSPGWAAEASAGRLADAAIETLAGIDKTRQEDIFTDGSWDSLGKKERTAFIKKRALGQIDPVDSQGPKKGAPDKNLARADRALKAFIDSAPEGLSEADSEAVKSLAKSLRTIRKRE